MVVHILKKAKSLGASLAGFAAIPSLQNAPSYRVYGQMDVPARAKSVLVLALAHPVLTAETSVRNR